VRHRRELVVKLKLERPAAVAGARPKETAKRAGAGVVLHSIQEAPDRGSRDDGLASLLRTRDSDLQKEATAVAR
jgi:hypothetical protein